MYTKYKYSLKDVLLWTRYELLLFALLAVVVLCLREFAGWRWLQIPWTPLALVGTAVAFLIGFQNNAAYGRAWEARKIWGGIVNTSRTWTMMVRDMVTNEHAREMLSEEALADHRTRLIHRHIAWMTALRFAMRTKKPWESFTERGTNKEWYEKVCIPERDNQLEDELKLLVDEDEFQHIMSKTNKSTAILALQSNHLRELKERGHVWEFAFLELVGRLEKLFDLQGKSERIKNFPYPRQYATIAHDFVRIFILLLPLGVIPAFSEIGETLNADFPIFAPHFVWLSVPAVVMVAWVFHTMLRIGTVGENPFEGSANDVPISTIARGIEIDLREMNNEPPSQTPKPLPSVHDVQM